MNTTSEPTSMVTDRRELVVRLHRAEGQVRAVATMIESGAPCETIATQLSAARKALDRCFYSLMACALRHPDFDGPSEETHEARVERLSRLLAQLA